MRQTIRQTLLPLLAAVLLAVPAPAHETKAGALTIDHAWSRPGLPNRPAAAYMVVSNTGDADDALVAAESPAFPTIELHTVERDGDVMKMRAVEAIPVPAGGAATLAPGGYHVMLFGRAEPFAEGERFPLTLIFEGAGRVEVEVAVERGAKSMDHSGHGD